MIILRVITSMDPSKGGPCQGIRNSIPELDKLGVANEVVCLDDPAAGFIGHDHFPITALGHSKGPWAYNDQLIPWLIKNLPRFDAVIIHGLWLYHGYAVHKALAAVNREIRSGKTAWEKAPQCYVMPHGMLDPYFQRDPSRRVKAFRNWIYWKLIERKVVNDADGVLFTCEEELRLACDSFRPYRPKKKINVGYGVAEPPSATDGMRQAFHDACPGLGDGPYLLFLSRIHPKKGVDLLIRAYCEIFKMAIGKHHSEIPSLVIAGPLESGFATEMRQLGSQLLSSFSVTENSCLNSMKIHFPGMLRGDAKWGAFHGCEAFVLPSHQENFGIAVAEALACSKPVLISNKVNIWREIDKSGAGMVKSDTFEGVSDLLNSWIKMEIKERRVRGENALNCYRDNFRMSGYASNLASLLE